MQAVGDLLAEPLLLPGAVFGLGVASTGLLASGNADLKDLDVLRLAATLVAPLVAAVLLDARPRDPLGILLALFGLVPAAVLATATLQDGVLPSAARAATELPHLVVPVVAIVVVALPLVFHGGVPRDALGRWVTGLTSAVVAATIGAASLRLGPTTASDEALLASERLGLLLLAPLSLAALLRQDALRRRSTGDTRRRRGWFLVGAGAVGTVATAIAVLQQAGSLAVATYLGVALATAVPVALALLSLLPSVPPVERALLRAGLLTALTAALLLTYAGALAALARTDLPDRGAAATTVTALVALALVPGHARLRDVTLARFFGQAHAPSSAMAQLGRNVDAAGEVDEALDAAATAVAHAVRSPGARVLLGPGEPAGLAAEQAVLPLVAGDVRLGTLLVEPRREGEAFSRRDHDLLSILATPVAQLARAALLARDLERSRGDAVAQRLDERRRLRRDLHDSVGPLLAGLGLQADAVRRRSSPEVQQQLAGVTAAIASCRQEVRRLVDGLEPDDTPLPDLEGAVRELVDGWQSVGVESGLVVSLDVPSPLPHLDDELRVTAYRVVGEALTNVVRHAAAGRCTVRLTADLGELVVEVRDDGTGPAPVTAGARRGFGLRSMAERARAAGGVLDVSAGDGGRGTTVRARLPLGLS